MVMFHFKVSWLLEMRNVVFLGVWLPPPWLSPIRRDPVASICFGFLQAEFPQFPPSALVSSSFLL